MTTDAPPAKKVKTPAGAKKPKANGDSTPAPATGGDGKFSQSGFHFAFNLLKILFLPCYHTLQNNVYVLSHHVQNCSDTFIRALRFPF